MEKKCDFARYRSDKSIEIWFMSDGFLAADSLVNTKTQLQPIRIKINDSLMTTWTVSSGRLTAKTTSSYEHPLDYLILSSPFFSLHLLNILRLHLYESDSSILSITRLPQSCKIHIILQNVHWRVTRWFPRKRQIESSCMLLLAPNNSCTFDIQGISKWLIKMAGSVNRKPSNYPLNARAHLSSRTNVLMTWTLWKKINLETCLENIKYTWLRTKNLD